MRRIASAAAPKKCPRLFQCWNLLGIDQPQVRFVNQRRRFERMIRPLRRHPLRRQLSQFLIHQRQQLLRGITASSRCNS